MGRSFGLAAYRALSRRSSSKAFVPAGTRPKGDLAWIHAAEPDNLLAIEDLAQRLCAARYDLHVLITLPDRASLERATRTGSDCKHIFFEEVPSEHPAAVGAFLAHWAPDVCIWTWGRLRPNLVHEATEADVPIALIDADTGGFDGRRDRWLPDLSRDLLSGFEALMVRTGAALQRLETLGLRPDQIELTPPLQAGGQVLPCEDADLTEMTQALAGRPVWFAARVQPDEERAVLSAHRHALRFSHRLLLILHPARTTGIAKLAQHASTDGFRVGIRGTDGDPTEAMQILLVDDDEDLGLFYRLAPVSFLGSSLTSGHGGCNPFEAAALGSAVLYGPNVRKYLPFYTRLANAGAARIVNDAQTLGTAVTRLIAPDQAAAMAHAGWDVISHGAALTDRVIDLVNTALDGPVERTDAHT
ncbi:3-deoxy-D-manno-octulosonic acid transferase [Roseobacter sp. YSTF-M11]|uniref:3-deoxy-D-manno-octulosonic acid transferase n=1 Tax=Roseobacter insulae TaxID=2859783 RepID=A0A9X1FRW2_9RHOB|nr:glycosyltransferase N-terminal domain-containing protein [Roseobacter insulae]MBW4706580.1 3-deoxy-D-manno-octulosonic acid transferase [Roseobacter insulae]